mgnify:CR=1 FL=1
MEENIYLSLKGKNIKISIADNAVGPGRFQLSGMLLDVNMEYIKVETKKGIVYIKHTYIVMLEITE